MPREYVLVPNPEPDLGLDPKYTRSTSPDGTEILVSSWPGPFTDKELDALMGAGYAPMPVEDARVEKAKWSVARLKADPTNPNLPKEQGESDAAYEARLKGAFGL